jgi:4-hydroxy-3-methylbut-2-enyl diphosphate reductase
MKILRASEMGMCFGVRDALEITEDLEAAHDITIHGELVHNEKVLERLRRRGFHMAGENDRDRPPATSSVLVTAHGISERRRDGLLRAGYRLIDTTCPLVRRVHGAAQELAREGRLVLVLGKPGHVEVLGIVEDLDDFLVVSSPADVRLYPSFQLGVVCQTTLRIDVAREILAAVRSLNPDADIRFADTVCDPTRKRIQAVHELVSRVDVLVVVGGHHSNNTRQLAAIGDRAGIPTHHVAGPEELRAEWFRGIETCGLTAGTSTLAETVDAVEREMEQPSPGRPPYSTILPPFSTT